MTINYVITIPQSPILKNVVKASNPVYKVNNCMAFWQLMCQFPT